MKYIVYRGTGYMTSAGGAGLSHNSREFRQLFNAFSRLYVLPRYFQPTITPLKKQSIYCYRKNNMQKSCTWYKVVPNAYVRGENELTSVSLLTLVQNRYRAAALRKKIKLRGVINLLGMPRRKSVCGNSNRSVIA